MTDTQYLISSKIQDALFNDDKSETYFEIGCFYSNEEQWASAFSFFMKATASTDVYIQYAALIRAALCLSRQGNRENHSKVLLNHAISIFPNRPEAYYHLSCINEHLKDYHSGYTLCNIGLQYNCKPNPVLYFPGEHALIFQKAVHSWWTGRFEESRNILQSLKDYKMDPNFSDLVQYNMSRIGSTANTFVPYTKESNLKIDFPGLSEITSNYSQTYQDIFVLTVLNGMKNGFFLEIGAADPFYGSNTALLEKFEWTGISIDIKEEEIKKFDKVRNTNTIAANALEIDYKELLKDKSIVDYLQLDCEPPENTFKILLKIPFDTCKFRVITFEHDHYCDLSQEIRQKSREYLNSKGYMLVCSDVAPDNRGSYEDWWVHPDLVSLENCSLLKTKTDCINNVRNIMLK